jgi:NAD(P)-dependent dehydrogenase (short-subunit alcohol dehydrogenase family)
LKTQRNYLVIGGSSGIGKAISQDLHHSGHKVFATYRTQQPSDGEEGPQFFQLDVKEDLSVLDRLPERLDGFVYCPGSINLRPFNRIKVEQFTEDFQLQVSGAIRILQKVWPRLKASDQASVLLFSTVAVQTGFAFHSQVAASKGAIEGLTRALAAEWAPGIRVNAIAPSLTDTPLASQLLSTVEKREANAQRHPLKEIGSVKNMADMANFLLSDKSSWITGQILHVDGGMSAIK